MRSIFSIGFILWALPSYGFMPLMAFYKNRVGTQTTKLFNCTGSDQSFVVPAGVTSLRIKAWGGGGGGGSPGRTQVSTGGGAGYVTGILQVTPGETLTVIVGCGGKNNSTSAYGGGGKGYNTSAGGGGGRTAIRRGSAEIFTAAGGGGGGYDYAGAAGGGLTGLRNMGDGGGGFGGTSTAGGATSGSSATGTYGSAFLGGDGAYSGGGGGSGYYGGGGASSESGYGNGGGGGSSYFDGLALGSTLEGNGQSTANTSDADYSNDAGKGGNQATSGSAGLMVIKYPAESFTMGTWVPSAWAGCNGTTEYRTLSCQDSGGATITTGSCDASAKPSTSRSCCYPSNTRLGSGCNLSSGPEPKCCSGYAHPVSDGYNCGAYVYTGLYCN